MSDTYPNLCTSQEKVMHKKRTYSIEGKVLTGSHETGKQNKKLETKIDGDRRNES